MSMCPLLPCRLSGKATQALQRTLQMLKSTRWTFCAASHDLNNLCPAGHSPGWANFSARRGPPFLWARLFAMLLVANLEWGRVTGC